jgi:16S rRNA (adenine1518-N6/adenine1519-N6)-dimethyltransferase
MIDDLPPLREVIRQHGLAARKSLGQNFLMDLNLTARIARLAAPLDGCTVIEVGPGPGGLTRALLAQGAREVVAIERDERCLPALEQIGSHYPGRLRVIPGDALVTDYAALATGPVKIVANLPYNIATKLLVDWLRASPWPPFYSSLTLMFQKEVAERICAEVASEAYGRLAVLAQWRTRPEIVLRLPARAFTPPPKVDSAVVQLTPVEPIGVECALAALEKVTEAAFGQRRKMLRSSLRQLGLDPARILEEAGIAGEERAERLTVTQFTRLARAYSAALS